MTQSQRSLGRGKYIQTLFTAGDVLIINILFILVVMAQPVLRDNDLYIRQMLVLINVSCVPALALGSMREHERRAILMERVMRSTFITVGVHALFLLSLTAFLHIEEMAGRVYLFYYGLMTFALMLFKLLGNYVLKKYRRRGFNYAKVVVIGARPTAERLASHMKSDPGYGYTIAGFFDDEPDSKFGGGKVYPLDRLAQFVEDNEIKQIFYTLSGAQSSLPDVIKICDEHYIDFYYVPQIPRTLRRRFELHSIGAMPVLSIRPNPLHNFFNRFVKRTFDLVVSSVFLCFYPLIYIPVAIAIKMSSPGPVYFKQERTGYKGRTFLCLKFRTMKVNKDSDSRQATRDDPRKTRIGDFLRRTSIDELPQFINVWKGDMSVIGPRPHMLKHTELYTSLVDQYMVRHAVKPGITGWAQVNGYRGITDELWKMERRVEHDVWYIENWTFLLDLKIMARTVINVFGGEKNAF